MPAYKPADDALGGGHDPKGPNGTYTPDQYTKIANAVMAFEDPGSFLNSIVFAPIAPPQNALVYLEHSTKAQNDAFMAAVQKQLDDAEAAWEAALLSWETSVLETPPQGPVKTINGQKLPSELATCSCSKKHLLVQLCVGGPFRSYSNTVSAIGNACNVSNLSQCPTQIQINGLNIETAVVAACTVF